ncbi:MAG: dockerin type I repeat-containing protein [Clostridiales bacterium]|nr:dockerin type I repeat-containing protein [Clostridiales bacterium]
MKRTKLTALLLAILLSVAALLPGLSAQNPRAAVTMEGVDAMLIYNPRLTYEYWTNRLNYVTNNMATGSLVGSGIVTTGVSEPSGMQPQIPQKGRSQSFAEFDRGRLETYLKSGGKLEQQPDIVKPLVTVGQTAQFWTDYGKQTFTARAVSTHCVIWGTSAFTNTTFAQQLANEFDNFIYPQTTTLFGPARYMTEGAQLNVLVYNMGAGICGYFWGPELMTAAELQNIYGENPADWNHSAPHFHLNSQYAITAEWMTARNTMAHEFQHLLHFTAAILNPNNRNLEESMVLTNEGFAMVAEELLYPGSVAEQGYNYTFSSSTQYRDGFGPYNWNGTGGVANYGFGWAFMDWYAKQAGSAAFAAYLSHWRNSPQNQLMDPNAFHAATPPAKRTEILNIAAYAAATNSSLLTTPNVSPYNTYIRDNNVLLSKMLLAFHIASVVQAGSGLYSLGSGAHGEITRPRYRSTNSATIQGGGCIYFTVSGGSFTVPAGANAELIYVGFKDGKVVIPPTTAADYTPAPPILRGDANCDGKVTAEDAALVLRVLADLATLTPQGALNAEVTYDNTLSAADAAMILRFLAGLIDPL